MQEKDIVAEISGLLIDGPISGKEELYLQTCELILGLTVKLEFRENFSEEFLGIIVKYIGENSPCKSAVYKILINLFSDENLCFKFCKNKLIMEVIMKEALSDIYNRNKDADYCCMLLSNITRSEINCLAILNLLNLDSCLHKMVTAFTTISTSQNCSLHQLSMVLCNLSQLKECRDILTQPDNLLLQKLVPYMKHENTVRSKGIIGLVHNCCFDSSVHKWLLSEEIDLLPYLLLPLAGPEQFDDEDNDKLPIDLQYLSDTKTREMNPEIRKQLLETLNKLCTTKYGRQYLRNHNTYIILRELHKWEKHPSALLACENVVDILIRTEDEIGFDDFNTVEIPKDLEEKFNKDLTL